VPTVIWCSQQFCELSLFFTSPQAPSRVLYIHLKLEGSNYPAGQTVALSTECQHQSTGPERLLTTLPHTNQWFCAINQTNFPVFSHLRSPRVHNTHLDLLQWNLVVSCPYEMETAAIWDQDTLPVWLWDMRPCILAYRMGQPRSVALNFAPWFLP
jgi:hypothetical protein